MSQSNPYHHMNGQKECQLCSRGYWPQWDPVENKQIGHPLCERCIVRPGKGKMPETQALPFDITPDGVIHYSEYGDMNPGLHNRLMQQEIRNKTQKASQNNTTGDR